MYFDSTVGVRESQRPKPRDVDMDMLGVMTATQDSFRTQLATMRENLDKVSLVCGLLPRFISWSDRQADQNVIVHEKTWQQTAHYDITIPGRSNFVGRRALMGKFLSLKRTPWKQRRADTVDVCRTANSSVTPTSCHPALCRALILQTLHAYPFTYHSTILHTPTNCVFILCQYRSCTPPTTIVT